MTRNLNNTDRAVRAVLGVVLVAGALAVGLTSVNGIVLLVLAGVMLVTSATGFCGLYRALGISTCPTPHSSRSGQAPAARGH